MTKLHLIYSCQQLWQRDLAVCQVVQSFQILKLPAERTVGQMPLTLGNALAAADAGLCSPRGRGGLSQAIALCFYLARQLAMDGGLGLVLNFSLYSFRWTDSGVR